MAGSDWCKVLEVAYISIGVGFVPKRVDLIAGAAVVVGALLVEAVPGTGLGKEDLRREVLGCDGFVEFLSQACNLCIGPRRAFLAIGPVESRLIDGVEVSDVVTFFREMTGTLCEVGGEVVVTSRFSGCSPSISYPCCWQDRWRYNR